MNKFTYAGSLAILLFFTTAASAQIAFPGAEGAGKFVTGGRGSVSAPTVIYEVTNLGDVNSVGSLRYAATNSSALNRVIVFRVSGTIHLLSTLTLNRANTTIAGQTAPGDGICIADYPVIIGTNNVILRYLRFRMGDKAGNAASDYDALSARARKNIIIDHCSVSWGVDENFSFYENDSCTIQYSMISEPLNTSYHNEGSGYQNHGYGGIWGGKLVSFHHNLFAHCQGRMPRFDGIRNIADENADFRNNVIYNWGDYNTNGGEGGKYNSVNNYYKYGPTTPSSSSTTAANNKRKRLLVASKETSAPTIPYGKFWMEGNYSDGYPDVTSNNYLGVVLDDGGTLSEMQASSAFNIVPITNYTADEAYQQVLKGAGAILPKRDTLDQRIINNVINRTGGLINVQGGYPAYTPYAVSSLTAWPTLNSTTAPPDADKDGMPDDWETRRGLNPALASDKQAVNANGYTNLENYLNGDSIVAVGTVNTCITTKSVYATNTNNWLDAKDSTYSNTTPMDSSNMVASIKDNGNFGEFAVSYYVTNTIRLNADNKPYLSRNLTITPSNPSLITTPVTVRFYLTKAEYNLLQSGDPAILSPSDLRIVKVPHATGNNCATDMTGSPEVIVPSATGTFGTYQNGYFLEFQTTSFSSFFVMSSVSAPLPVDLLSFTASSTSGQVKTAWTTANQVSVSRFEVQRSSNGQNFQTKGIVQAVNTGNNQAYTFADSDPLKGLSYYRLKMIDNDGKFTYSQVISVNNKQSAIVTVKPNPVINSLTISYPTVNTTASIWIFAADGKKVMEYQVSTPGNKSTINVSNLERGYYELIFINGDEKLNTRFLKQ